MTDVITSSWLSARSSKGRPPPVGRGAGIDWGNAIPAALLVGTGTLLWWLCAAHAAAMPFWAPWDFSWVEFLGTWVVMWWFGRGLARTMPQQRPSTARLVSFVAGMLAIYVVLETHFEYAAQHMFLLNRIQHVVMHHLGPMLIALSWPGAIIFRGMPGTLRRLVRNRWVVRAVAALQQPVIAASLFVGVIFFWLLPAVHFRAMIDCRLFSIMNWSMVIDGVLFWVLVLDPRPSPAARASFDVRAAVSIGVMFPQILGGALIVFSRGPLYPSYDLCGRLFPQFGALADQTLGGLVIWIPPAMMSVLAFILVLNSSRRSAEARVERSCGNDRSSSNSVEASLWTGR